MEHGIPSDSILRSHVTIGADCQPARVTYNVNPGWINPKRLFNSEGTIKKYWMKWLLEEYPLTNKPWFINPGLTLYIYILPLTPQKIVPLKRDRKVKTCQNMSKHVKTCQNMSKPTKIVINYIQKSCSILFDLFGGLPPMNHGKNRCFTMGFCL